jgi:magnesium-transporting ATPase (P-type)
LAFIVSLGSLTLLLGLMAIVAAHFHYEEQPETDDYVMVRIRRSVKIRLMTYKQKIAAPSMTAAIKDMLQHERLKPKESMPIQIRNRNFKGIGTIETFIGLIAFMAIVVFGIWFTGIFLGAFPEGTTGAASSFVALGQQTIDNSIVFLFFIICFIDLLASYFKPSIGKAFFNIILLCFWGYLVLTFNMFTGAIAAVLPADSLMPNFYAFATSDYLVAVVFFFICVDIILNFRKVEDKSNTNSGNGYGSN